MRLLVSGGGTGGHVYPALSVIDSMRSAHSGLSPMTKAPVSDALACRDERLDLLWVGSRGGIEAKMVKSAGVEFVGLAAGGVRGMGPWTALRNGAQIVGSSTEALHIVRSFRPDVALVTGGYACVPVTLAAWAKRVPVLVYLPDIVPGLAIRFLSRLATSVAVTSEDSVRHLPRRKVVVTGYPVRPGFLTTDRAHASRMFSLDPSVPTLLVFGGSRGARSINQALVNGLPELLPTYQVIHVSGDLDTPWVEDATQSLPRDLRQRYLHYTYLAEMPAALVAADLAVARAGAATMGEFPAAGLPSIMIPYPYSGQHQAHNARYMERHGAARVLADSELQEKLVPTIKALLADRHALSEMRAAAMALARPNAAADIAQQARLLARRTAREGIGGRT